ncbi:MAG TPA: ATP-binding protein [Bacteroidales bacterium]|nr:ATP-binding protein [Bacteroidales bacterium]HNS46466.1 ATP-binding protein [Bacteroidales bacterium]
MEIAVISGKGGTGKSSLVASFATLSERLVLVDCDVDAANLYILFNPLHEEVREYVGSQKAVIDYDVCTHCGLCLQYCRFDAISVIQGSVKISDTYCDGCFLCSRICPEHAITMVKNDQSRMYAGEFRNGIMVYGRLAPGEENSGKMVNELRDRAKQAAKHHSIETILLDGPPGIGCPVISTITGVDAVVIVTEPTLSALHDLERTLGIAGKFKLRAWVVINKYDINPDICTRINQYCKSKKVVVAGNLPFDPQVVDAMVNCKSMIEWAPDSVVSREIRNIWKVIHS